MYVIGAVSASPVALWSHTNPVSYLSLARQWCACVIYFVFIWLDSPCYANPCHHGMARPRLADGKDGIQIWRVAADILNKQERTADSGWSSRFGFGPVANNSP